MINSAMKSHDYLTDLNFFKVIAQDEQSVVELQDNDDWASVRDGCRMGTEGIKVQQYWTSDKFELWSDGRQQEAYGSIVETAVFSIGPSWAFICFVPQRAGNSLVFGSCEF